MSELSKLQEVCAALREQLDRANIQNRALKEAAMGMAAVLTGGYQQGGNGLVIDRQKASKVAEVYMEILVPVERAKKQSCRAGMPFGMSGVPDYCGKPLPCADHPVKPVEMATNTHCRVSPPCGAYNCTCPCSGCSPGQCQHRLADDTRCFVDLPCPKHG